MLFYFSQFVVLVLNVSLWNLAHQDEQEFFDCSDYANIRYNLFHNLSWLPNDCVIDLKLLTSGNRILSNEQNEIIFKHVFEYIKRSERFVV